MCFITVFGKETDEELIKRAKQVASFIADMIGDNKPQSIYPNSGKAKFLYGGGPLVLIRISAGETLLPTSVVDEVGQRITNETEGVVVHFLHSNRYFISGVGEV